MKHRKHRSTSDASLPKSSYLSKLIGYLAADESAVWREFGEAARYVKQLAEIEWNEKVQWALSDDAAKSHRKREYLIQIISRGYPEAAEKLGLPETETVGRGEFCDQVIDEMKRIKNLVVGTGRSMAEVEQDRPELAVWKVRGQLSPEDQDVFNHPRQWGPVVGYAKMVLSKIHGVSTHTITSWLKAHRKGQKTKKA